MIPFNKPHLTGKETHYIYDAVSTGKLSGNGKYTKLCQDYFEKNSGFKKCLLTTSCTDALEMAAILINIKGGDEVIMPSYTFVSTANAFILRGANIVFADSNTDNPNINTTLIESLITPRTKAIVPVHYAGIACDMDTIMSIAAKYSLFVIEDAAQAIDSFYTGRDGIRKPLGSIGHMAAFSFHETKNIIAGEGGMLAINDEQFVDRAEIIWEKGTNRSSFFRGEVDKYGWVDIGSSFLPAETVAAFLWAQLENLESIQNRRREIWNIYNSNLKETCKNNNIIMPVVPSYASNNGHMFFLLTNNLEERTELLAYLKLNGILAVFHYLSLHKSVFYQQNYSEFAQGHLPMTDHYSNTLIRLPLYFDLSDTEVQYITDIINKFYTSR